MPKMDPKAVQTELEKKGVRPVYFLVGTERMKARELVKKIQAAALQGEGANDFNLEKVDASEVGLEAILDAAQGTSLLGGVKVIVARNAEELRNLDRLADYLNSLSSIEPRRPDQVGSVLILISKSLDGRKKASKSITELAALVSCDGIEEKDRGPWVEFLAKRRGAVLSDSERIALRGLDPWTLDIVDQEISKLELVGDDESLRSEAIGNGLSTFAQDHFMDALFTRDSKKALEWVHHFSGDIDVQLPFLGLVAWNFRQLKQYVLEQETRTPPVERRYPALVGKLDRWRRYWDRPSLHTFEHCLFEIDFSLKNTRLTGQGLWTQLIWKGLSHQVRG